LSGADVLAEDKLFATLDPVTRRVTLADGGTFLLVDTVGFIRKLPTTLVNAFRSTLEETVLADLLLIIHDASSPDMMLQHQVVQQVLTELGAGDKPQMDVLNKCDVADESSVLPGAVRISASTGAGLETLKTLVSQRVCALRRQVTLFVPYAMGAVLTQLHTDGQVMEEQYEAEGTLVTVQLTQSILDRILRKLGTEALRKIEG
ncbi:MAG: GTPase, partial [Clostridia bacterium]